MKQKSKKRLKQSLFTTGLIIVTLGFNTCLSFGDTIAPTLSTTPSSQVSYDNTNKVILEIGNAKMSVFKLCEKTPEFKDIDSSPKVVPLLKNGRTLLPLRSIVETFGGNVSWNSNTNCSQININNKELLFYPGKRNFKINGKEKELLVSPEIINGRTYLPLRDFSENTGFVVNWKPADKQNPTSQVEIIKPFTGLFPACINDADGEKWGFIDSTGEFIIKPQFKEVSEFNMYGIAEVITDEGISFIDSKGNLLVKPILTNNSNDNAFYDMTYGGNIIINGKNNINYVYSPEGTLLLGTKMNIQNAYDKLISFKDFVKDKYLFGFIDFKGHIVVSAKYSYVGVSTNGAYYGNSGYEDGNVETYFNEYGDIIPASKSSTDSFKLVYSDGLASYLDSKTNLYGYKNVSGQVVISPKFASADSFIDGFAYVTIKADEYSEKNVIIDRKGKGVFEYNGYEYLTNLGNGLFLGGSTKKTIIDAKTGKTFPSDIFNVVKLDDNIICVSEMNKTYFIDSNMNKINTLPTFEGLGDVSIQGDILKVSTNKVTGYFKNDGSPVWIRQETTLNLDNGVKLHYKLRSDSKNGWTYSSIDYNPIIEGISDKKVEEKINSKLKEMFNVENAVYYQEIEGEGYWETTEVSMNGTPILNKDLLVIAKDTYIYTGGAHGFGSTDCANINLKTGELFTLDDLLKKNSGFENFVAGYLSKQTGFDEGIFSFKDFDKTYSFKLGRDCLELVFPNFNYSYSIFYKIPYSKIMSFIDTDSVLWNSFEKDTNSILVEDGINQEEVTNLIAEYENAFIKAVNSNNFDVLKNVLIPDSSLYKSQKALIPELNKKGIKEKLNTFKIEEIVFDPESNIVVTVSENIGISTNGGEYKDKDFLWSYKVARNKDGDLKLYYIENASK